MTGEAFDLEKIVNADVFLMGSFLYTSEANDIDLVLVYKVANYEHIKKLKKILAEAIFKKFHISIHFTTLNQEEYEAMDEFRLESNCLLFES